MDHELDEMVLLRNAWRIAKLDRDKYALLNAQLLGRVSKLTSQLEQARSIATLLEAECSAWPARPRFGRAPVPLSTPM